MTSPVNRKFKERWSPKSSVPVTMEALDHCQEPTGTIDSPSTPFSISHTLALPLVLFSDDDIAAACRPI